MKFEREKKSNCVKKGEIVNETKKALGKKQGKRDNKNNK